jgi:hypothetical protein
MFLFPDIIHQTINHQASSSDALLSSSSNPWPSPPPPAINLGVDTGEGQKQPSSFMFIPIQGLGPKMGAHASTPYSTMKSHSLGIDAKPDAKPNINGREKGAVAYSIEEPVFVLKLILSEPNSFNANIHIDMTCLGVFECT